MSTLLWLPEGEGGEAKKGELSVSSEFREDEFMGWARLEFYKVVMNKLGSDRKFGKITCQTSYGLQVVYTRPDDEDETTIPENTTISLSGPPRPCPAYDPITLFFRPRSQDEEESEEEDDDDVIQPIPDLHFTWSPYRETEFNKVHEVTVVEEVDPDDEGNQTYSASTVTLTFMPMECSIEAAITLSISPHAPIQLSHALVYAITMGDHRTKRIIHQFSGPECLFVSHLEPLPVVNSVLAVPMLSNLDLYIELKGCYDDHDATPFDLQGRLPFCAPFRKSSTTRKFPKKNPLLKLTVNWEDYIYFR